MDLKLGLIADYANVAQDGKLNVMGIFSRVLAKSFPVTHPSMHLVLVFTAGAGERGMEKDLVIRLLDADGATILEIAGKLTVPDPMTSTVDLQQVIALQMLQFPRPGSYGFHVMINGETKSVLPLVVEQPAPLGL